MKVEMKANSKTFVLAIAVGIGLCLFQNALASTISGTVYDNHNNSLPDVDIELLNDYYQLIDRTRTEATGRYEFGGLVDGRYTVRALPFRYDLLDQSIQLEIFTSSVRGAGQGNTFEIKDFYLQPRKGSLEEVEASVLFAQDIPKEAKKAYAKALDSFTKRRNDEAIVSLNEAVAAFPNYFLALNRLGRAYVVQGKFSEAFPVLIKAADINPKSPTSLYYLGYALHKLNYNKAALVALTQGYNLSPNSVALLWMLGVVERLEGKYTDAEKHLTQAKKLSRVEIPEVHFELAQLYGEDLKKYNEAADELEAFLKARPDAQDALKIKEMIKKLREKGKSQRPN